MAQKKTNSKLQELAEFRFRLREFLSFSEDCADAAGVTAQQYQLLQVVGLVDEASISLVAQRMLLRHNSAVELVDRAERAGLVVRAADTADQRRSLVRLTLKGADVLNVLLAEHLRYLRKAAPTLTRSLAQLGGVA